MRVFSLWLIIVRDRLTYSGQDKTDVSLTSRLHSKQILLAQRTGKTGNDHKHSCSLLSCKQNRSILSLVMLMALDEYLITKVLQIILQVNTNVYKL